MLFVLSFRCSILGEKHIEQGFSSFKFIPHRPNEVIALKTVELADRIETCMVVIYTFSFIRSWTISE
jgi:hypothetical protein